MSLRIIVIIPAFNEQDSILKTVNLLKNSCPTVDYIVVNDGSTDNTKNLLKQNNIHHLNLPINLGIGGAVQTGYLYALENDYDIAVQFDGDGQHDANFISALVQPLIDNEADLVIGSRFIDHEGFQSTKSRRAGIGILRKAIHLTTGQTIHDPTSGFRAVNKKLIQFFSENYAQDYPEPESIVESLNNGFVLAEVPVLMNDRTAGSSSINQLRSIYYMIKVTIAIFICYALGARNNWSKSDVSGN